MRYLSSYSLIKESVAEAKSYWKSITSDINDNIKPDPILPRLQKILHKNPGYIGPFYKLIFRNEENSASADGYTPIQFAMKLNWYDQDSKELELYLSHHLDMVEECYNLIIQYKQLFKTLNINNYSTFEELEDYLNNTIIHSNRLQFVKKFVSSKYMHLINDDTIRLFDDLKQIIGDDHTTFNQLILSKIASFKTSAEFNSFLNNYLRKFGDWSVNRLEQKSIDANANIIFKDDNVLIIETPTFNCLSELGSQNWCIVRSTLQYNNYLTDGGKKLNLQYVIFDTSKDQSDIYSMIGVTIEPNRNVKAAHLLDDSKADKNDYKEWLEYLKPITKDKIKSLFKDSSSLNWIFQYGFLDEVLELKKQRFDFSKNESMSLRISVNYNHTDIVKILLSDDRVDPSVNNNICIQTAVENCNTEIVKLLLSDSRVDPSVFDNDCIVGASGLGYTEIVKVLLEDPRVDSTAMNYSAIKDAARRGYTEIVKLLVNDPKFNPNIVNEQDRQVLRFAVEYNYVDIVKVLLELPNISLDTFAFVLRNAAYYGYNEMVKLVLSYPNVDPNVYPNIKSEKKQISAIQSASDREKKDIVKLLAKDKRIQNFEKLSEEELLDKYLK